jgi:hypothetical protein
LNKSMPLFYLISTALPVNNEKLPLLYDEI